jgi:hypothetical protein
MYTGHVTWWVGWLGGFAVRVGQHTTTLAWLNLPPPPSPPLPPPPPHVSSGGSVCLEALVATGTPNGWQSNYSVDGVLLMVLDAFLNTSTVQVGLVRNCRSNTPQLATLIMSALLGGGAILPSCRPVSPCPHMTPTQVRTPHGPGGTSGPLRVDLDNRYVMTPYTVAEAQLAFNRWASPMHLTLPPFDYGPY